MDYTSESKGTEWRTRLQKMTTYSGLQDTHFRSRYTQNKGEKMKKGTLYKE